MIRAKERRRHQFHQFCSITISTDVGLSEVVMSTHCTFGWKARERLPESAFMLREGKHFKDSGLGKVFAETMHTWIGHDLMVRGESPTWHLIIKMLLCSVACDGAWSHSYLIVPTPSLFTSRNFQINSGEIRINCHRIGTGSEPRKLTQTINREHSILTDNTTHYYTIAGREQYITWYIFG